MVSFPVATRLWRRSTVRREWIVTLAFCLLPLPGYLHALAWNRILTGATVFAGGWLVAVWVQAMALLPLAILLSWSALEAIPDEVVDSARLLRPDSAVFLRIVVPLALPALWTTAALLFLLSTIDYTVFALFSQPSYSLQIHVEFSAGAGAGALLGTALPLISVCALPLAAVSGGLRRAALASAPGFRRPGTSFEVPAWWRVCEGAGLVAAVCQILVPISMLLGSVRSPARILDTVIAAWPGLGFSLLVAALAVAMGLPLALGAARMLASSGTVSRWRWFAALAPAAAPAPLVGIGLILLWNTPWGGWAYGTILMPLLAALARFLPLATLVVAMRLRRIDPLLEDAARVFQTTTLAGWLRVRLPMLAPGLVAASALLLAFTWNELGATLLVVPPGRQTLTLRIYNYLHYGDSQTVAGLCLVTALVTMGAGYAAGVAWRQRT
jgi:iron(III) transport system permease protein